MSGDGEPSSDGKGGGGGGLAWRRPAEASRQTRHLSKFIAQDKENFFFFPANNIVEPLQQRSPLPVGYPRVPLQDITSILSPLNQPRGNGDEGGEGHKRPKQRKSRKKPLLPCPSLVEESAAVSSSEQVQSSEQYTLTVTETVSAAPKPSEITTTVSSRAKIQEQSTREEIVLELGVNESDKHVEVSAESSVKTQVKTKASSLVVTAPGAPPARGAAPRSPTSRESKRRKPHTTKPTPGQNVARFR
ncbi:hypothetical protein BDL97_07G091400 [Sphagnum fallax]|nr:hypothetical protein BDL97_07G091400 [Sphagnum fallax]